jgi:hypothetical protein
MAFELQDDGLGEFIFSDAGKPATIKYDICLLGSDLLRIRTENVDIEEPELLRAILNCLADKGFPPMSSGGAMKFSDHVIAERSAWIKKNVPTLEPVASGELAASTAESTPPDGAPASSPKQIVS